VIEVGAPRPDDYPALLALLPEAFPAVGDTAQILVARRDGARVGAAAIAWSAGGFPLLVRVEPAHRRRGIGRALVEAAVAEARGETSALKAWQLEKEGSDGALLAAACGFTVAKRLHYFSADAAAADAYFTRLLDRMRRRIPPGARVVPIGEAPRGAVAAMLADNFAVPPRSAAQRLDPANADAYHPVLSSAVLDGEALAGAILCRIVGDVIDVEVNMVAPAWRGGWANLMLLAAMARAGRAHGIERFIFGGEAQVRDTINLAPRSGAVAIADRLSLVRPL
jgi:mycothiol synthase